MPNRRQRGASTIRDVAMRARVSPMTVSRVINGNKNVKPETRESVETAIRELSYSPNPAASSLARADLIRIGLLYGNPSAAYLSEFLVGGLDQCSRSKAEELVSRQLLEGMPRSRIGTTAVSDLVRVNRVQGLAFGVGMGLRFNGGYEVKGSLGYGLSDRRVTVGILVGFTRGATDWTVEGRRTIRDFGDEPVVSGVVNSLLAQEAAIDLGSYLLGEEVGVGLHQRLDPRWSLDLSARFERSSSVATVATPSRGVYEPNPPLGSGSYWLGRAVLVLAPRGAVDRGDLKLQFGVEAGSGPTQYLRASFRSDGSIPVPLGHLRVRTLAGVATPGLPKARSFAIGGRGTLPAETFRQWGGRRVAAGKVEWRVRVPVPEVGIGPFASTGNRAILAPFVGVGWAGGTIEGVGWRSSDGARPVAGVAFEFLQNLLRFELATPLRERSDKPRRWGLTLDVSPEWWPIL